MPQTLGSKPDLSLVIPCFNEAGNAEPLVARLAEVLAKSDLSTEVIFVDGGSGDGTRHLLADAIKRHGLRDGRVKVMPSRGGYGRDILHGLSLARADVLGWTHADLQTDPADVLRAYALFHQYRQQGEAVMVKGRRIRRPILDAAFTFGMQVFVRLVTGRTLSDINAQPKIFDRSLHQALVQLDPPSDFSLDLFLLWHASAQGLRIATVPVVFADRRHGEAKGGGGGLAGKLALTRRTMRYILALRGRLSA